MSELITKSASELAGLIESKEISSVEATEAFFDRSESLNHLTLSYLHLNRETALAAAKAADSDLAAGKRHSALHGVPIAVKDNLTTTDAPTTAGSKILEGWVPQYDSTVVERIKENPDVAGLVQAGLVRPEQLKDEAYVLSLKSALANRRDDGRPASLRGRVRRSAAPVFERSVPSRRTSGLKYFKPAMHVRPSIFAPV